MSEAGVPAPTRVQKSATAFRTIGEVAGDLDLPAHILRFWESKFPQLKPLKRGGGRRYYRPEDVLLLRRIRQCLYQDGYTIRGVQKLLGDPAGVAVSASGRDDTPSLFPLDAASDRDAPQPPARRPRRPPAKPGVDADLRASLDEIRRELLEARALIADLLRPPKAP